MLYTVLSCTLMVLFTILCATFTVSVILAIIEECRQAKRNEARELRDIEYHNKRMNNFK